MSFPSKETRLTCYNARDKFWECLDANDEKLEMCKNFRQEYERVCSDIWVKHFDRKREYAKYKAEIGADDWSPEREEKPV